MTIIWLPGSERTLMIHINVLIQYWHVTDRQTDSWMWQYNESCA